MEYRIRSVTMNVLYIFDDNYADISGVSICSLLKHNDSHRNYHIYIIDGGISQTNKEKLLSLVKTYNADITFLPFINPEEVFGLKLDLAQWCETNYLRIILERILPENIHKILYIDSDTLIRQDLSELYDMNLNDYPIAAAYDCYPLPKYQLGLSVRDKYYSDGILLIDLNLLRKGEQFKEYSCLLRDRNGKIAYLEQGAINYVMKNRIMLINPKYNLMTLSLVYKNCPKIFFDVNEDYYNIKELENAIEDPAIVHLTGNILMIRPWCKYSNHPYSKEWRQILESTPWATDFILKKVKYKPGIVYAIIIRIILFFMKNRNIAEFVASKSKRMREIRRKRQEFRL